MYSAAVNGGQNAFASNGEAPCPSGKWRDFPFSSLWHHGGSCCDVAREWLLAMDYAQLNGGDPQSGPGWIRGRYEWGPSAWPIHWCDVLTRKVIDCGAHSALAHEAFTARGLTAYRAQFVQRYSHDATRQWRTKWGAEGVSDHWLDGDVIYHEGNALLIGEDEVKLWDSSAGWWLNPRQNGGYGGLVAVRLFASPSDTDRELRWGAHRLPLNRWQKIGASPTAAPDRLPMASVA